MSFMPSTLNFSSVTSFTTARRMPLTGASIWPSAPIFLAMSMIFWS